MHFSSIHYSCSASNVTECHCPLGPKDVKKTFVEPVRVYVHCSAALVVSIQIATVSGCHGLEGWRSIGMGLGLAEWIQR